tara:strand:+ start:3672 stop:4268 length:597 start_codon:yes stop_codon:yes gene_type:complete
MWIVKIVEFHYNITLVSYGVLPKKIEGLKGIFFSPFIHKDFTHLINNTFPILILGILLFFTYKKTALSIFFWLFFISGFWLWIIGRPSYHIGASGIIYSLASFLFFSGVFSKNRQLIAISLVIIFSYGYLIWGIFPINSNISWEGHLTGLLAGLLVAFFYKNSGPEEKKYDWELEEEESNDGTTNKEIEINYIIRKKN